MVCLFFFCRPSESNLAPVWPVDCHSFYPFSHSSKWILKLKQWNQKKQAYKAISICKLKCSYPFDLDSVLNYLGIFCKLNNIVKHDEFIKMMVMMHLKYWWCHWSWLKLPLVDRRLYWAVYEALKWLSFVECLKWLSFVEWAADERDSKPREVPRWVNQTKVAQIAWKRRTRGNGWKMDCIVVF